MKKPYAVRVWPEHGYTKETTDTAPQYSMRRGKTGKANSSRLTKDLVRDIRHWAAREGAIFSRTDQVRELQRHYPVSNAALFQILDNTTWHDPTYTPGKACPLYWRGAQLLLLTMIRSAVSNATGR